MIVRHDVDRSRYIDALALSDRGGDTFPMIDIMLAAEDRFAKEINRRDALRRMIDEELQRAHARDG